MSGRIYAASLVALSLLIASEAAFALFLVLAALYLLVLVAWALVERDEANAKAAKAEQRAEVFADEICHVHAANEILCAELAASDEKNRRLSNDLREAKTRISDLIHDAEHAPAPVIPLPVVREASPYICRHGKYASEHGCDDHLDHLANLAALDAEATEFTWPAIAREAFPIQWWGEEAEK